MCENDPTSCLGEQYLNIPVEKIGDTVQKIEQLLKLALVKLPIRGSDTHFFADHFLVVHSFYMIADALARQKVKELEEFASPLFSKETRLQPNEFTSLPFGDSNAICGQIQDYFAANRKAGKKGVIFPFDHVLQIEKYYRDCIMGGRGHASGIAHVRFLSQFIHESLHNASNLQLTHYYIALWQNPQICDSATQKVHNTVKIPQEVYSLYYLAFLSFSLISNASKFPPSLQFVYAKGQQGRKALQITCNKVFKGHPSLSDKDQSQFFGQFHEMDIRTPFVPLYEDKYQTLSTNQAVTARLAKKDAAEWRLTESVYRDLLRIVRRKNLALHLALGWASTHITALEHPGIQQIIDQCFFSPGTLPNHLRENPALKVSLRDFVRDGVSFYKNNLHHLSVILFFIRTGILIETHVSTVFGKEFSKETLAEYREDLVRLLNKIPQDSPEETQKILWHLILCETQREPDSEEEIVALFSWIMQQNPSKAHVVNYNWLVKKLPHLTKKFASSIELKLENDPSFRNTLCNTLLQQKAPGLGKKSVKPQEISDFSQLGFQTDKLFGNPLCRFILAPKMPKLLDEMNSAVWTGTFPQYQWSDYVFDFSKGELIHKAQGRLVDKDICNWVFHRLDYHVRDMLKQHHRGEQFWESDGTLIHANERLKLIPCKDGYIVQEKKYIGGKEAWYELVDFNSANNNREDSVLRFLTDDRLQWVHYTPLEHSNSNSNVIFTFDIKSNVPLLKMEEIAGQMVVRKVDQDGKTLPIELLNLKGLQNDVTSPFFKAALRIASPHEVLCFFDTEKGVIDELNFLILNIQFKRGPRGLESVQYPGYIYEPDVTPEELNHFLGAMVIRNNEKTKVLLPKYVLNKSGEDFSRLCLYDREDFYYKEQGVPLCLQFDVNSINGDLVNSQRYENFYLALLLKKQRDYDRAAKYLA